MRSRTPVGARVAMRRFGVLLWWMLAPLAVAQTVHIDSWPNGALDLNQGWRVHDGDDTAWARPEFNDSGWQADSMGPVNDQETGSWWYRLRVQVTAEHPPLALMITGGDGTYELYVNGQRMPGPKLRSPLLVTYPKERVVPVALSGETVIALRTFVPATSMFIADRGAWRVELGTAPAIERAAQAAESARLNGIVLGSGVNLLAILIGIALLILFWLQRDHREYFWLGLYLILVSGGTALFSLASAGFWPFSINWFISVPTVYLCMIAQIEFTFSFVGQRVNRGWRIYEALLLVPPIAGVLPAWFGAFSRGVFNVDEVVLIVPAAIALPILLLVWYRRGLREAGWLIVPSLFPMLTIALNDVGIIGSYLGAKSLARMGDSLPLGIFSIQPFDIADLLFLLAIGVVMFFRFTRVSREQARSAAELQAAREIQQRLVPASLPRVAGYTLEAAYLPAEEVGGDFYQVLEQADGGTLIVVGDVSGKGLKAAMTGTLTIGALRTLADEGLKPAALLARLNRQITRGQEGGFVTCLCVRISAQGMVTAANAGHLAPYRNGEEVTVESGLPLGVTAESDYSETLFRLEPGETLTLLSDGVVEAQSAGGELFGFERTCAISGRSAEAIAQEAHRFGQKGDITVLTVTLVGAGVVHA
ncbi:MAG TPA: SpoIIE family protein phosphatase [Acidobacteriaceae bacterium]